MLVSGWVVILVGMTAMLSLELVFIEAIDFGAAVGHHARVGHHAHWLPRGFAMARLRIPAVGVSG